MNQQLPKKKKKNPMYFTDMHTHARTRTQIGSASLPHISCLIYTQSTASLQANTASRCESLWAFGSAIIIGPLWDVGVQT